GTENLAAIAGLVECLELFVRQPVFSAEQLSPLTEHLIGFLNTLESVRFVGSTKHRLSNTVSFVVKETDSTALLANLDLEGVCASSGSACASGSLEPSLVVRALGLDENLQRSLVRFS